MQHVFPPVLDYLLLVFVFWGTVAIGGLAVGALAWKTIDPGFSRFFDDAMCKVQPHPMLRLGEYTLCEMAPMRVVLAVRFAYVIHRVSLCTSLAHRFQFSLTNGESADCRTPTKMVLATKSPCKTVDDLNKNRRRRCSSSIPMLLRIRHGVSRLAIDRSRSPSY